MRRRVWALPVLATLLAAAPASASFQGTPGKVAYVTGPADTAPLKLWDPAEAAKTPDDPNAGVTTLVPQTFQLSTTSTISLGYPAAPSWSHDGTRLAYVKSIDGTGNSPTSIVHTAIFVYDVRTGAHTQLTHPAATLVDTDIDLPLIGHSVADYAPAWNDSDTQVAFVRQVGASPDDELKPNDGTNVWTVTAGGGSESRRTSYTPEGGVFVGGSMVWIPGTQDVMLGMTVSGEQRLVRQSLGGGATTLVAGGFIADFDASPDGKRFSFSRLDGGAPQGFEGDLASGAAVEQDGMSDIVARYSNSGDALLYRGAKDGVSGLIEKVVDPDKYEPSPDGGRMALPWHGLSVLGGAGIPGRMQLDIQPQTLPVIFVPGFLGSQITCGSDELWPDMPFPDLTGMNLTADGHGNANCAAAGPSGDIVESVLGSDVYHSTADWLRGAFDSNRMKLFGWDFRKEPQATFDRLDQTITDALAQDGPWKDQKAGRVVLYGHSYGGLLIRSYIEGDGGAKVARVLTAGAPYWGSPKSIFPLAFGIESPLWSSMDLLINNTRMQSLAVNLAGLFHLYPSDHYGPWLTVNGTPQDQAGVLNFVTLLGGNFDLLGRAFANHRDSIDGFYNRKGFIDVRVVAGKGLNTIGSFDFVVRDDGDLLVGGNFVDGDETVPLTSAAQTQVEGARPLGDEVGLQYACNIKHVPLPGSAPVRDAYEDWLDYGRPPKRLKDDACRTAVGGYYSYESSTIGLQRPRSGSSGLQRTHSESSSLSAAAALVGAPLSLDQAEATGLIDMLETPQQALVVVDDDIPVNLRVPISNGTFTYTPLTDGAEGQTLEYGPLTGTLELDPGAPGGAPVVKLDGTLVEGRAVKPPPPIPPATPPGTTPSPGPGPGATPSPGAPIVVIKPPPTVTLPGRLAFVGRARLRGQRLTMVLKVPAAGALRATLTQHTGRRSRTLGVARTAIRTAGRHTLTMKLRKRPHGKLKLAVTFTPKRGRVSSVTTSLRAR
jgi:hypothetical protein